MPGGGGYQSITEYEIGAQRIAEAAHCVLGSLGKGLGGGASWGIEKEHLNEEMGIIENSIKEYSKSLYLHMINDPEGYGYKPQYVESVKEWTRNTVASIRKASPSLASKAKKMMGELNRIDDIPEPVRESARLTYVLLIELAAAMIKSVKDWNKTQEIGPNAYSDPRLRQSAQKLKGSISRLVKMGSVAKVAQLWRSRQGSRSIWRGMRLELRPEAVRVAKRLKTLEGKEHRLWMAAPDPAKWKETPEAKELYDTMGAYEETLRSLVHKAFKQGRAGIYWSRSKRTAKTFAERERLKAGSNRGTYALLEGIDPGVGHDVVEGPFADEDEVTLPEGTPVKVRSISFWGTSLGERLGSISSLTVKA